MVYRRTELIERLCEVLHAFPRAPRAEIPKFYLLGLKSCRQTMSRGMKHIYVQYSVSHPPETSEAN